MSGPAKSMPEGWRVIRQGIKTDEPQAAGKCLGCDHKVKSVKLNGRMVNQIEYDMQGFMEQCVSVYLELTKRQKSCLKNANTPFLDDNALEKEMVDLPPEQRGGTLQPIACKVLMKILYAARLARFDLLKAVQALATKVTKWDHACDRKLHRLVCYINSTLDFRLMGHIGDSLDNLSLALYSDADFASCLETSKSTSGVFIAIKGPNTFFPLNACSKKQTCVSHSTPEAEIVAADVALRTEGLPALQLWDLVFKRKVKVIFMEDNQATMRILQTGRNPTLRHLGRTHRVDLAWLSDVFRFNDQVDIRYCVTSEMCADIFTKSFTNPQRWAHACDLVCVVPEDKRGSYGPDLAAEHMRA